MSLNWGGNVQRKRSNLWANVLCFALCVAVGIGIWIWGVSR